MHKGLCTNLCGPFGPFGAKKGLLDDNLMISWVHWTSPWKFATKVERKGPFGGLFGPKRGSKLAIMMKFFLNSVKVGVAMRPILNRSKLNAAQPRIGYYDNSQTTCSHLQTKLEEGNRQL